MSLGRLSLLFTPDNPDRSMWRSDADGRLKPGGGGGSSSCLQKHYRVHSARVVRIQSSCLDSGPGAEDCYGVPTPKRPAGVLDDLGYPNSSAVAAVLDVYAPLRIAKNAINDLRDFDWCASLVLGAGTTSNIKEPICTFRFHVKAVECGSRSIQSPSIELTLEEAQLLLNHLEVGRTAQRELLRK
jgi:hypothetical protein